MRLLVTKRRFFIECHQVLPREVPEVLHRTGDGVAIHVDIEGRHEDADLHRIALEILILPDRLQQNNLPVRRGDHQPVPRGSRPVRIPEEIQGKEKKKEEESNEPISDETRVDEEPSEDAPQQRKGNHRADDVIAIFAQQEASPVNRRVSLPRGQPLTYATGS